jgi:signal transduction histidine kinase
MDGGSPEGPVPDMAENGGSRVRLTQKIALLVLVPVVAMTAFAGLAVAVALTDGARAGRLSTVVELAQRCAELAEALQVERVAAVSLLVGPGPEPTVRSDALLAATAATDAAIAAFRASRSAPALPGQARERLDQLTAQLDLLTAVRDQAQGGAAPASAVAFRYRIIIASTVAYREIAAQAGEAPAELAGHIRAAVELSRAAEALGLQQVAVLRAVDAGRLTPAAATEVTATRTGFTDAVVAFTTSAPSAWRGWWQHATTGPEVLAAQAMQDSVARTAPGAPLAVDATAWAQALRTRIGLVHDVEARADGDVLAAVARLRKAAMRSASLVSGAVLAAAALAIGLAVRLGRPVVRDLRRLRDGARAVAYEVLPQLVTRLNQPRAWRDVSPDDVVASAPSTGIRGKHEVAEVAAAFDDVYRAAVRSAAELARSRFGVANMLVALARRVQRRTSQMTSVLDGAERNEQDAARLALLFRIDHLNTLTRRTTDSLLVLGGHGPGTVRAGTVAVLDVLRAAAGRIEDYARVRIVTVDEGLVVAGYAADELALLLAELMDNAVTLSQDQVTVHARRLADRMVIQVIDAGVGLDERRLHQLNGRLAAPVVDVDAVSQMGLTVVGLLAAHHGLRVELRPNPPRGAIAEITVPAFLLRDPDRGPVPGARADRARGTPPQSTVDEPTVASVARHRARPALVGTAGEAAAPAASARSTPHGLPVRPARPHIPAGRVAPLPRAPMRDPQQVAAALAAYARGVSHSRAQNRPPWTDNQGS